MLRNRGEIRAKVRMVLGDADWDSTNNLSVTDTAYFSDAAYNRFINDAYANVLNSVPYCEVQYLIDSVASTSTYSVEVRTIDHIDYDGKPLEGRTAAWLERHDASWRTRTGTPRYFVLGDDTEWSAATRQFRLYPTPDTSTSDVIRVIGKSSVPGLTNDFCAPALPGWMHDAVVYEAVALCLESFGDQRNDPLAQVFRSIRDAYITEGLRALSDRYPAIERIVGTNRFFGSVYSYDPHIPTTGRAGAGD